MLSSNVTRRPSIAETWALRSVIIAFCWAGLVASVPAGNPLEPPAIDDFTEVRLTWSKQTYVQPLWEVAKGRSVIFTGYRASKYNLVLDKSKMWLEKFPIDAPVHWMRAQAFKLVGNMAGYARHMYWYRGLLASMHSSGDGRAPESAITVVALREEHFLVRDLGGEIQSQELIDVNGATYHKTDVVYGGGQTGTLFFDIAIPVAQLERNTLSKQGIKALPSAQPAQAIDPENQPAAPRKE